MTQTRLGSTYRLQLHGTGFSGATELVPYLSSLGIETVYLSPVFASAPGSTHGYDVIDPGRIDPALGSAEDFEALLRACGSHSMRVLLDIVPNHMSTDISNSRWWDVLARGRASVSARLFDIDWSRHAGRVLLPVLGRPLAEVLEDGSAEVVEDATAVELDGLRLPLAEGTGGGAPAQFLERQHYRAAFWRSAATMGNYRRFFDINGLVGVRVEDPAVFEQTHELVRRLCADDRVAGVRVDHVDGLADPRAYLGRLRRAIEHTGPKALLVEKILAREECLPADWPTDGTTGYEFGDLAGGLLLGEEGTRRLAELGAELTGEPASFAALAVTAKGELLTRAFDADLDRLARLTLEALDHSRPGHDLSRRHVRAALTALTVHLDVYRTYLDARPASPSDRTTMERTAQAAAAVLADDEARRGLLMVVDGLSSRTGSESPWLDVARRWQQLSGAVMAKGVEDTATYRYPGLLAHAEVGCDPDGAALDVSSFHRAASQRLHGLNTTSTHDSKRNEDARCRLAVLSEASEPWARLVRRWHRRFGNGADARAPHPGEELATYQALLALWPLEANHLDRPARGRVQDYVLKAARETKRRTSWDSPDGAYERRLSAFVTRVTGDEAFRAEMSRFSRRIGPAAVTNSLSLLVLKCCMPGTPDFYQGTELFAAALTDPDNRRPVDFVRCRSTLAALPAPSTHDAAALLRGWPDGRLKLFVMRALLHARRRHGALFEAGDHRPLTPSSHHVVSFARRQGDHSLICLAPRLTWTLAGGGRFPVGRVWNDETVEVPRWAQGAYAELFTGRTLELSAGALALQDALATLPVAVLLRDGSDMDRSGGEAHRRR